MHFEANGVEHRTVLRFIYVYICTIHLNTDLVKKPTNSCVKNNKAAH